MFVHTIKRSGFWFNNLRESLKSACCKLFTPIKSVRIVDFAIAN